MNEQSVQKIRANERLTKLKRVLFLALSTLETKYIRTNLSIYKSQNPLCEEQERIQDSAGRHALQNKQFYLLVFDSSQHNLNQSRTTNVYLETLKHF